MYRAVFVSISSWLFKSAIGLFVVFYLLSHAVFGSKGVMSYIHLKDRYVLATKEHQNLSSKIRQQDQNIGYLRTGSINKDKLTQILMSRYHLLGKNEYVVK